MKEESLTSETLVRFGTLWRNKWLTADAETLQDMIGGLRSAADTLAAMLADGVVLDPEDGGVSDDYAYLITTNPEVAKKYDMDEEEADEDEFDETDAEVEL